MMAVESSNVSTIGYNADEQEIHVEFSNGAEYAYSPCPKEMWEAFQAAASKGQFVQRVLKKQCSARRV